MLARQGVPRWAGVIISYVAVVVTIWALVAYALPPISRQAREFIEALPGLGATLADVEVNQAVGVVTDLILAATTSLFDALGASAVKVGARWITSRIWAGMPS